MQNPPIPLSGPGHPSLPRQIVARKIVTQENVKHGPLSHMDLDYIDNDNSIMARLRQKSRRMFGTGFKGYSGGSWDRVLSNRGRGNKDEKEVNKIDKTELLIEILKRTAYFFNHSFLFFIFQPIFHVHGHERRPLTNVVSLRNLSWMNKEKKMAKSQQNKNNDESNQSQDNHVIRKNQYHGRSSYIKS